MIPLPVIFALVSAVAGFTGAYFWQEANYERRIADIHSAHASQLAESTRDALARTVALQAAKDKALKAAAVRQSALTRAAAAVRDERDGLRDELAASTRALPDASCASVREYSATANSVFGLCADRLERMASEASGHASDSLTLQQSWPKPSQEN